MAQVPPSEIDAPRGPWLLLKLFRFSVEVVLQSREYMNWVILPPLQDGEGCARRRLSLEHPHKVEGALSLSDGSFAGRSL